MKTIHCNQLRKWFDERLDNQLAEPQRELFDRHVAVCPECGRQWQDYSASWELLTRLDTVEPSFGFVERTLRRLDEPRETTPITLWQRWWNWTVVGVTTAVLVICGWMLWQQAQDVRNHKLAEIYAQTYSAEVNDDIEVIRDLQHLIGKDGKL